MEDVMETCYIDSVTMCSRGYKCNSCPREKEHIGDRDNANKQNPQQ